MLVRNAFPIVCKFGISVTTIALRFHISKTLNPYGIIVQFGGQTAINLAEPLTTAARPIIGSSAESIDMAEDRERFEGFLAGLGIPQPPGTTVLNVEDGIVAAATIGYPVVVLSGVIIGFMGWMVWSHHMFTVGLGPVANSVFAITTMARRVGVR